jgi:glycosyltransferase involved in cell wall biosynthesis
MCIKIDRPIITKPFFICAKIVNMSHTVPLLSFIVPVMNEAENIATLHAELVAAALQITKKSAHSAFEIIFVDDGSTDNTVAELKKLSPITIIELRRNFGQTAALDAGIKAAKGEYLVTLDGDGQNDPGDVPALLNELIEKDVDVVCGWRAKRKDSSSKRFVSAGAKWLRSFLVNDGIHDSGCTLRVYRSECFEGLTLRGEMHRFIPALLKWRGYKVTEMPVNHRPRLHGVSKYSMSRTVKGFLDMLSLWFFRKYASRPLHFLGGLGLLSFAAGVALGSYLFVMRLFGLIALSDSIWPLAAVFLALFGIQMFVSGLLMEMQISNQPGEMYQVKRVSRLG